MAEHRVPMLSPALHRPPDPEHSRDPRVRALVSQLRTVHLPGPRPEFRDELRTQLVAITPRIVAEGAAETEASAAPKRRPSPVPVAAPAKTPSRFRSGLSRLGHVKVGRPLAVITCVIAVFAVLLGGAVWISKRALPGDTLYGLKRASENLQEAMTSGDSARAKLFLDFANNRYGEVSELLPKSSGPVSGNTASLVTSTLSSADGDIKDAMQALGSQAIRNRSGSGLGLVTAWAGGPLKELRGIVARMPAGDLHRRGAASLTLLTRAEHRAAQLKALGDCDCLAHARTDDLGAVPCTKCSSAAPAPAVVPSVRTHSPAPHRAQQPAPATQTTPAGSTQAGTTPSTASSGSASQPASAGTSGSGSSSAPGIPGLPSLLPSGSGGSTCTGLDLGLISIGRCGVDLGGN